MVEKLDTGTATNTPSVQRRRRRSAPSLDNPMSQMTYQEYCRLRAVAGNVVTDVSAGA